MTEYRLQYRGTLFPVRSGEVILGRSSYASIVVNNPLASREHAVVRAAGGGLEVSDLGSKNGTYVNGKRIEGTLTVDAGDVIKIGTDVIEVARLSAQDPQALRIATEPGRSAGHSLDGDTTVNLGRSLELTETILVAAPEERRPIVAGDIVDILSELLAESQLDAAERGRAQKVVRELMTWDLTPALAERCSSLVALLAQGTAGSG